MPDEFNVTMVFRADKILPDKSTKRYPQITVEYFEESRDTLLVLEAQVEGFIGGLFSLGRVPIAERRLGGD